MIPSSPKLSALYLDLVNFDLFPFPHVYPLFCSLLVELLPRPHAAVVHGGGGGAAFVSHLGRVVGLVEGVSGHLRAAVPLPVLVLLSGLPGEKVLAARVVERDVGADAAAVQILETEEEEKEKVGQTWFIYRTPCHARCH